MNRTDAGKATVERDAVRLDATFDVDATSRRLRVRYHLHNGGDAALAVFDRGDTLAVAQGRLTPGTVGAPATEQGADGLSLQHRAVPLRRPAPTVPPVPLAARLAPGDGLDGELHADVGEAARVRYCLAVAPFDAGLFSARQHAEGIDLWRASFDVVGRQWTLCTPWFDVADGRFLPP